MTVNTAVPLPAAPSVVDSISSKTLDEYLTESVLTKFHVIIPLSTVLLSKIYLVFELIVFMCFLSYTIARFYYFVHGYKHRYIRFKSYVPDKYTDHYTKHILIQKDKNVTTTQNQLLDSFRWMAELSLRTVIANLITMLVFSTAMITHICFERIWFNHWVAAFVGTVRQRTSTDVQQHVIVEDRNAAVTGKQRIEHYLLRLMNSGSVTSGVRIFPGVELSTTGPVLYSITLEVQNVYTIVFAACAGLYLIAFIIQCACTLPFHRHDTRLLFARTHLLPLNNVATNTETDLDSGKISVFDRLGNFFSTRRQSRYTKLAMSDIESSSPSLSHETSQETSFMNSSNANKNTSHENIGHLVDTISDTDYSKLSHADAYFRFKMGENALYAFVPVILFRFADMLVCCGIGKPILGASNGNERRILNLFYPESGILVMQGFVLFVCIIYVIIDTKSILSRHLNVPYLLMLAASIGTLVDLHPLHVNRQYVNLLCALNITFILLVALPLRQWYALKDTLQRMIKDPFFVLKPEAVARRVRNLKKWFVRPQKQE